MPENYYCWDLIISALTAIGTCGATILALYFWLNSKKIKMNIRSLHADSYGNMPSEEDGFFVVNITNYSYHPLIIEFAGLKAYNRKCPLWRKPIAFLGFENTKFDSLPKRLEYSESYTYAIPMREMRKRSEKLNLKIATLKIFICVPTARRDIYHNLNHELISMIINR